jgi:uncharacterized protein YcfJ
MNKTMMTGVLAGIGIAVAGGVAGFTVLNNSSSNDNETAAVAEDIQAQNPGQAATVAATARSAPAAAVPAQDCWDEEVVVQAAPRDDEAIAGTAAGAVIGGALADRLGDDDDLVTAAGAAAGAYIGRRAQREYQENQTTTVIEQRCAPVE